MENNNNNYSAYSVSNIMSNIINYHENHKTQPVNIGLANNMKINEYALEGRLMDIDQLDDSQLTEFVKANYQNIFNYLLNNNESKVYLKLFLNFKFIDALAEILKGIKIDTNTRNVCCRVINDYLRLDKEKQNDTIQQSMLNLASVVTRDIINIFMDNNIPGDIALKSSIALFSTLDMSSNIYRMNKCLSRCKSDQFTEQNIINIYQSLGTAIGLRMTVLFETHMLHPEHANAKVVYNQDQTNVNNNEKMAFKVEDQLTENVEENYSVMSLAILSLLECLSINDIKLVLSSYTGDYYYRYNGNTGNRRFSMRNIAVGDYPRIIAAINQLESESVIVP